MRTTSLCLVAATISSLGLASSASAAGEAVGSFRRSSVSSTLERIEFFLLNTGTGGFAGSTNIAAAEVNISSDKPMVVNVIPPSPPLSLFPKLPSVSQSDLATVTESAGSSRIFGGETSFMYNATNPTSSFGYVGTDVSGTLPRGVLATSDVNGGRGAAIFTIVAQKDAVVTLTGRAANENFTANGALEAQPVLLPFSPIVATVPEPTSLAVLGVGAAVALRRKAR